MEPSGPVQSCTGIALHFYPEGGCSVFLRNVGTYLYLNKRNKPNEVFSQPQQRKQGDFKVIYFC